MKLITLEALSSISLTCVACLIFMGSMKSQQCSGRRMWQSSYFTKTPGEVATRAGTAEYMGNIADFCFLRRKNVNSLKSWTVCCTCYLHLLHGVLKSAVTETKSLSIVPDRAVTYPYTD